jgi:hypothetical protein
MPFDWTEFLDLAKGLKERAQDFASPEAALRSAVSRAYFAAFCFASSFAQARHGFVPDRTADDHRRLRAHFGGRGMWAIVSKLDDLRLWRNSCDYDETTGDLERLAISAIGRAEHIIKTLRPR